MKCVGLAAHNRCHRDLAIARHPFGLVEKGVHALEHALGGAGNQALQTGVLKMRMSAARISRFSESNCGTLLVRFFGQAAKSGPSATGPTTAIRYSTRS